MNPATTFDADLLRRYDKPGPRYTSYPAAPQFHSRFGAAHLHAAARRSNTQLIPRALSIYVHVPYCASPCFYCGCNRVITRDVSRGARYLEHLAREIELLAPLFERNREVVQLHFGGGTPNFLTPAQLGGIVHTLGRQFKFAAPAARDFSIELDPRFIEPAQIAELAALGFNRASLGVQDLDPQVQHAINRVQSAAQTLDIIAACRANGFRSVNVDLIYGLPKQTLIGFARTLDTILAARPDRLAVYGYAHLPKLFKAQRQIESADLPGSDAKLELLQLAIAKLTAAGYLYIGMDHFALPEDELARAQANGTLHRNFMGYTTHADSDLIGLGVSAISHIGNTFSQNPRDLLSWENALDAGRFPVWRGMCMDEDDELRGAVIQSLMCHGCIDRREIETRFDLDFAGYFAAELEQLAQLQADGLVTLDPTHIRATPRGRLLVRVIAACFDRYLRSVAAPEHAPTYSRVV